MKRILLYGGAFNPPHLGHERLLAAAIEAIKPDVTVVTPSEVSPHKQNAAVSFNDRAYMARTFLTCGGNVKISGIEHSGKKRKSYTFQTVKRLQKKYKNARIYVLMGSDMLLTVREWHLYRRLCPMVTIVAAGRRAGLEADMRAAVQSVERLGGRVMLLDFAPLDMSSTHIRRLAREQKDVAAYVSEFVAQYINKRKLYQ